MILKYSFETKHYFITVTFYYEASKYLLTCELRGLEDAEGNDIISIVGSSIYFSLGKEIRRIQLSFYFFPVYFFLKREIYSSSFGSKMSVLGLTRVVDVESI